MLTALNIPGEICPLYLFLSSIRRRFLGLWEDLRIGQCPGPFCRCDLTS